MTKSCLCSQISLSSVISLVKFVGALIIWYICYGTAWWYCLLEILRFLDPFLHGENANWPYWAIILLANKTRARGTRAKTSRRTEKVDHEESPLRGLRWFYQVRLRSGRCHKFSTCSILSDKRPKSIEDDWLCSGSVCRGPIKFSQPAVGRKPVGSDIYPKWAIADVANFSGDSLGLVIAAMGFSQDPNWVLHCWYMIQAITLFNNYKQTMFWSVPRHSR